MSEDRPSEPGTPEIIPPGDKDSEEPIVRTRTAVEVRTTESFSGPLPPAAELAAYDKVHPGAADRIIRMAESYAEHTQELEKTALGLEGSARQRGQWLGVIAVCAVLGTCLFALNLGYESFATVMGTGTIVALAAVFVLGKVPEWFKKRES